MYLKSIEVQGSNHLPIRSSLSSTTESPESLDLTAVVKAMLLMRSAGYLVNRGSSSFVAPVCRM